MPGQAPLVGPDCPSLCIHHIPPLLIVGRVFYSINHLSNASLGSAIPFSPDTTDLEVVRPHWCRAQPHFRHQSQVVTDQPAIIRASHDPLLRIDNSLE